MESKNLQYFLSIAKNYANYCRDLQNVKYMYMEIFTQGNLQFERLLVEFEDILVQE